MAYADNLEGYRARLEAKLEPQNIRSTLAFAGLYQITQEMIVQAVQKDLAGFYGQNVLDGSWDYGEDLISSRFSRSARRIDSRRL